jgi:cell wall-associated NlpC family hydrolase
MLSFHGLPSRTSGTHDHPNKLESVVSRLTSRRVPSRVLVKGLLGLSLPAALLSASIPQAQPIDRSAIAAAATFALPTTAGAFLGDLAVADDLDAVAATAEVEGTLDLAAPVLAPSSVRIAVPVANVRSGPGLNYRKIGKLRADASVTVLLRQGDWFRVRTPAGYIGWVALEVTHLGAVSGSVAATTASGVATINNARTNLRAGPGTGYASLGKMAAGYQVAMLGRCGCGWIKVRTPKGNVGWVSASLVSANEVAVANLPIASAPQAQAAAPVAAQSSVAGSGRNAIAAQVALRYVGARYRWGGASPSGFDCSGLVLYAYRQAGLWLPHKASAQFSTRYGARIRSIGALRTGDIVFFANTAGRGITHAAIYVGGGRMVSANTPRSGVRLENINSRYWRSHFAGAIRP